jgi:hypothetical protein
VPIKPDYALKLYLITLSVEEKSVYTGRAKDYLLINQHYHIYGSAERPKILEVGTSASKNSVEIKFVSDWMTTKTLSEPKGFLIYFECNLNFFVFQDLISIKFLRIF